MCYYIHHPKVVEEFKKEAYNLPFFSAPPCFVCLKGGPTTLTHKL
jgi:hypothetical protein